MDVFGDKKFPSCMAERSRRFVAIFLALLIAFQPAVTAAAVVPVAHSGVTLDAAGNGVPVIQIATPNASGLSHNRYDSFNVDAQGAILNNAAAITSTQLGGYIEGNPHLAAGSARLILNEVTSNNRSHLNGYLEVAGPAADVVIASPNGVTCNGCGFINTPRVTLSAGIPLLNASGTLDGFRVTRGDISVLGNGANTGNVSVFELIAQSVHAQAAIHADGLAVHTGSGDFDRDGVLRTADPTVAAPDFAIDTYALGGMYANRIRLIANQDGVGVRIAAPLAAQTGELQLHANGVLAIQGAFVSGPQVQLQAPEISVDPQGGVYAGDATLHTDRLRNDGLLYTTDTLQLWLPEITALPTGRLNAGTLHLRSDGDIIAQDWQYTANGGLMLTAAGDVRISGSALGAATDVQVAAQNFVLSNDALLYAGRHLDLDLTGNLTNQGLLFANDSLRVQNSSAILNGDDQYAAAMIALNGDLVLFADERVINTGSVIEAIHGNVQLGDSERPIPLVENVRTGLQLSAQEQTHVYWSTKWGERQDGGFPGDDAWWLEHCYYKYGFCGDPYVVEDHVARENAARTQENSERIAAGLAPIPLIDYRAYDPADYDGVTRYLERELAVENDWKVPGKWNDENDWPTPDVEPPVIPWVREADHENRRFIRQTDYVTTESIVSAGRAGQILSGGDMAVSVGTLHNTDSLISAGNNLDIVADVEIVNASTSITEDIETHWIQRYNWHNTGGRDHTPENVPEGHPAVENTSTLIDSLPSVIEAGGALTVTGGTFTNRGHFDESGWQSSGLLASVANVSDPSAPRLPYLGLPGASGLFVVNRTPGHRYLVETRPQLATYAGFLGSDYLIERLGQDPGATTQRLGDAFYELQLIRESLVALTGSRFLSPDYADEQAQYLALLDNGVYAAQSMQLSLGVALTAEQINALTADMVWMEERNVAGYRVLVPVVYLAPGSAQLRATGALVAGNEVRVNAQALTNTGTWRVHENLQLQTAGLLRNDHGDMAAGNALALVSGGDLVNRGGSVQAGGDVLLASTGGDVVIETPTERIEQTFDGGNSAYDTRIGGTASLQAGGALNVIAAGNIDVVGAHLAGNGVALSAGGDVVIASQQVNAGGSWQQGNYIDDHLRQLHASVSSLSDVMIEAGNDLVLMASTLQANGDVNLYAGHDVQMLAANDSDYAYRHSEKENANGKSYVTQIDSRSDVVSARAQAGGALSVQAANDLTLQAAQVDAVGSVTLDAGHQVAFLSALQSAYSLRDSQRSGSWGVEDTRNDEVSHSQAVGTTVQAGADLHITSQDDQRYQAAQLISGGDIDLVSTQSKVVFEGALDTHQESHQQSSGDLAWISSENAGRVDQTLRQTEIAATGELAIRAAQGVQIDIRQVDEQTVSQMIDGMVAANPDLAWLQQMEKRGDIDWKHVKEVHEAWHEDQETLGQGAALAISIVVAAMTGGMGATATSGLASATTVSSSVMSNVLTHAATEAAVGAVITGATSQVVVGTINNGGDWGAALSSLDEKETLDGFAVSALTAGITAGVIDRFSSRQTVIKTDPTLHTTHGFNLRTLDGFTGFTAHAGAQAIVEAGASSLILGGDFEDYLQTAAENQGANVLSAVAFYRAGNLAKSHFWAEGNLGRVGLHAVVGGAVSEATGGDFVTGAAAAGLNQALHPLLMSAAKGLAGETPPEGDTLALEKYEYRENLWRNTGAQLAGLLGAAAANGDVKAGARIAGQADAYNRQLHKTELTLIAENAATYAAQRGISEGQAFQELVQTALARVDAEYANDASLDLNASLRGFGTAQANNFLNDLSANAATVQHSDGVSTPLFTATPAQFNNPYVNANHLRESEDGDFGFQWGFTSKPVLYGLSGNTQAGSYQDALTVADQWATAQMKTQLLTSTGLAVGGVGAGVVVPQAGRFVATEAVEFVESPLAYGLLRAPGLTEMGVEGAALFTDALPLGAVAFGATAALNAATRSLETLLPRIGDDVGDVGVRLSGGARGGSVTETNTALGLGDVPNSATTSGATERGVAFFGKDNLRYYAPEIDGSAPVLGGSGKGFFFMPIDDAARVSTPAGAAIQTGFARSAKKAWQSGEDIYGVSFPLNGLQVRTATTADAGGWRHFLDGGHTAVNVKGTDWFLVNKTREFVVDGGLNKLPDGSVIFRLGDQGEWVPMWRY